MDVLPHREKFKVNFEYKVNKKRVDIAIVDKNGPFIFIEIKSTKFNKQQGLA